MSRKFWPFISTLLIVVLLVGLPANKAGATANELKNLSAQSYVLMDADSGKILASRNAHLHLPPASMTKLMTLCLALEAIDQGKAHKTDRVITSKRAASMDGTRIYLEPGDVMRLNDLLISMALASANDASVAVAEKIGGSEAKFVQLMNEQAKVLGMKDSCFKNVNGLPADGHYSCAYDMAVLGRYMLANTSILKYTSLKEYRLRQGEDPIYNGNKLLWRYPGVDGLKTGYTNEAKNCLTATAKRGNLRLIAVVMGCPLRGSHLTDTATLFDYGFKQYASTRLMPAGKVCATVKVKSGRDKVVPVIVANEVTAIYPRNQEKKFTYRQKLPESIDAPIQQGQKLGEMQILYQGKFLKSVDLLAANSISQLGLLGRIWRIHWIIKLFLFIFLILYSIRCFNLYRNKRRRLARSRSARSRYNGAANNQQNIYRRK